MPKKVTRKGQKKCPACDKWVKGTRAKTCPKCSYDFTGGKQAPAATEPVVVAAPEAPAKPANAVTIEQIKMVGQMVKTIGGYRRLHEMLGVIKEVGGVKKFKDLLEAMAITEP